MAVNLARERTSSTYPVSEEMRADDVRADWEEVAKTMQLSKPERDTLSRVQNIVLKTKYRLPSSPSELELSISQMRDAASAKVHFFDYSEAAEKILELVTFNRSPFGVICHTKLSTHVTPLFWNGRHLYVLDGTDNFFSHARELSDRLIEGGLLRCMFFGEAGWQMKESGCRTAALSLLHFALTAKNKEHRKKAVHHQVHRVGMIEYNCPIIPIPSSWAPHAHNQEVLDKSYDDDPIDHTDFATTREYREAYIRQIEFTYTLTTDQIEIVHVAPREISVAQYYEARAQRSLAQCRYHGRDRAQQRDRLHAVIAIVAIGIFVSFYSFNSN